MTTVHSPRIVAGTGAIAGEAGATDPAGGVMAGDVMAGDVVADVMVLPGSLADRALQEALAGDPLVQPGDRLRRLQHRRRLAREELLAVLFLLAALAATVALLAMQWLDSGVSSAGAIPTTHQSVVQHLSGGPV